jgi:HEPN domain-containing protein
MSLSKAQYEANRWLKTAEEDLEAARMLNEAGKFSHACFLAQQSGEKAMKSLWLMIDEDPWGHSIQKLVMQYPKTDWIDDLETWASNAAFLDKFYIPTRYPNGLPDLTPGQSFTAMDAELAIQKAVFFVEQVNLIAGMQ